VYRPPWCRYFSLTDRLFGNVFSGVVLKNTQKTPSRNRKVVAVGLTKILSRSEKILEASNKEWWCV
jgi:hypothetical protein